MRLLLIVLALAVFPLASAQADDGDALLPVEQAFTVHAEVTQPGHIDLHWDIAPHYYLYRARIHAGTATPGVTLAALDLPPGLKKHDEFQGDVEVYHGALEASLPYTAAAGIHSLAVSVTVQGCHEVDPKICYPPHTETLDLAIPAATRAATPSTVSPLALKLGQGGSAAGFGSQALPLPPEQAFVFEAIAAGPTSILARWTLPPGYYLYRDKSHVAVSGEGVTAIGESWPEGVQHTDEHFGTTTVYFNEVELPIAIERSHGAAQTVTATAEFQGCQDNGICYPVMQRAVEVKLPAADAAELAAAKERASTNPDDATNGGAPTTAGQSEDQVLAARLSHSRLWALLSFFGFGLLLAFTPCVFPMIPILSGIIAGAGENISTARAFVLSVVYVLATCVVFTIAGIAAGLAGANLQAAFQQPWILWCFATLFVLLALSMFGFYELQLPGSWQSRIASLSNRQKPGSLIGVAIMGVLSALIVGPCVAPPLAAAVLYISQTRDPVFGGAALFVLALGMGLPLVVFGTAAGRWLPRAGAWMDAVKAVFGVLFLGLAIWMLSRILDPLWIMLASGVLLVASAVYLGALEGLPDGVSGWRRLWKALGLIVLIAGAAELVGALAGNRDLLQPLGGLGAAGNDTSVAAGLPFRSIKSTDDLDRELAAAGGKPVMLDFQADWCVSCKEMEKFTFSQPAVRQALSGFVLLEADVTANDDADQALLKRFGLFGPPATIFFGPDGAEQRGLRLIGFEDAAAFAARVAKAAP
jgi:thiol:disulfide interchange protein DsbD